MKKIAILILLIITGSLPFVFSSELLFNGFVRNYTGIELSQDPDLSIVQNTFDLDLTYYGEKTAFLVHPVMSQNMDKTLDIALREAYIDLFFNKVDVRIGKQQIIWGKSDGIFITDVVSPKDLREFILPDFNEIRIGVTGIKTDYYKGNATFEFIWLPVFTPNILPDPASRWNLTHTDFSTSSDSIDMSIENSEVFGRTAFYTPEADLELICGYMWDDEPTPVSPSTFTHHRLGIVGGSVSTDFKGFVFRSEGAYYIGKYFMNTVGAPPERKDYIHYLVGVNYNLNGWTLSSQFIQKVIMDYDASLASPHITNSLTFLAGKDFFDNLLRFEVFTYFGFNDLNGLVRPKLSYSLTDDVNLLIGANLFFGSSGTFGQYDDNDMVYAKIKLSF